MTFSYIQGVPSSDFQRTNRIFIDKTPHIIQMTLKLLEILFTHRTPLMTLTASSILSLISNGALPRNKPHWWISSAFGVFCPRYASPYLCNRNEPPVGNRQSIPLARNACTNLGRTSQGTVKAKPK